MMPQMDGIETTQKLRASGYKGNIVALTANALVGNDEMFKQNGFDGFVAKPIDVRRLNHFLNTFIRDRYPEEAKKYMPELSTESNEISPKILKIFCNDARKAINTIQKTLVSDDITLFTITVHAMKSALANVNEPDASKTAADLEEAGLKKDMGFIAGHTDGFIKTLETLIEKLEPKEAAKAEDDNINEDTAFLSEQLAIIKNACENYDIQTAYAALNRLNEKQWKAGTADAIENIWNELHLNSGFEEAASIASNIIHQASPA
jgi:CheY-like chemotaxis protein